MQSLTEAGFQFVHRVPKAKSAWAWGLLGLAVGAFATHYLDPVTGRRRRALLRDKGVHYGKRTVFHGRRAAMNSFNRALGWGATLVRMIKTEAEVTDSVLVDRVRSRFGRLVSHPRSVRVDASNGDITLSGPILSVEAPELVAVVRRTPGVRRVINNMMSHRRPDRVPGLQS